MSKKLYNQNNSSTNSNQSENQIEKENRSDQI